MRAIAALMVVITHSAYKVNQLSVDSKISFGVGGFGVDLFFMISGFVIFMSVSGKNIKIKDFIYDRIVRIIPLYWIVTTLALFVFVYEPRLVNSSGGGVNIINSYFLIPSDSKFLIQNGWTLSYEFYFYILMSVFIFLFSKDSSRGIGLFSLLNSLVLIGALFKIDSLIFSFMTDAYLTEFSLGVFIYFLWRRSYIPGPIFGLLFIILSCSLMLLYELNLLTVSRFFISFLSASLIFFGFICLEPFIRDKVETRFVKILVELGSSSYSLYLFHPFFLSFVFILFKYSNLVVSGYIQLFFYLLVSVVFSHIIYHRIERPITYYLKSIKNRKEIVI